MKEKHKKIIVNGLHEYTNETAYLLKCQRIFRLLGFIALLFAVYYLGMYRVNIDCVKHKVKYQSNQNYKFYWYDEFIKVGVDKREVD